VTTAGEFATSGRAGDVRAPVGTRSPKTSGKPCRRNSRRNESNTGGGGGQRAVDRAHHDRAAYLVGQAGVRRPRRRQREHPRQQQHAERRDDGADRGVDEPRATFHVMRWRSIVPIVVPMSCPRIARTRPRPSATSACALPSTSARAIGRRDEQADDAARHRARRATAGRR
jgi:hypothetical protein